MKGDNERHYCQEAWRLYDLWIVLADDPEQEDECMRRRKLFDHHYHTCEECK